MKQPRLFLLSLTLLLGAAAAGAQTLPAKETYHFAHRDTCELFLDLYRSAPESQTTLEGAPKPTILFVFGGGFITGRRDDPMVLPWFQLLTEHGYSVVSVDYRLGLKGVDVRMDLFHLTGSAQAGKRAVEMGVEDVFDAIRFLSDERERIGIDPDNLVIAGSSAGAMIALSSVLESCTPTERTARLPQGFRFRGLISFAGAIMSDDGLPTYTTAPPPQLLIHGTADRIVTYNQMRFGRWGMFGTRSLVEKVYAPQGYPYMVCRYLGHTHDMAAHFLPTWPWQERFLETFVMQGKSGSVDATVDDPDLPVWEFNSLDELYHPQP